MGIPALELLCRNVRIVAEEPIPLPTGEAKELLVWDISETQPWLYDWKIFELRPARLTWGH